MKILIAAALVLVQQLQQSAIIQPGQTKEPCLHLSAGERIEVSFSADGTVDFNIHYKDSKGEHFPVLENSLSQWTGVYIAPHDQQYCLMWTNNHSDDAVDLSYSYQLYRMERK